MIHVFFIDPIEKLNIKKDSSLMMALTFKERGDEVYFLFEKDFYINNQKQDVLVYAFDGQFKSDGCYLAQIKLLHAKFITLSSNIILHMRIDPPFDTRYLRYLWMLDFCAQKYKVHVANNPRGIMHNNEKLLAYRQDECIPSFVGASADGFSGFIQDLKRENILEVVLKPIDLYSGIGVEKFKLDDPHLLEHFKIKSHAFQGAIIAQPFMPEVYTGEFRSIYFNGNHLGTILKMPKNGEFISNIAQGAEFKKAALGNKAQTVCERLATDLMDEGVRLVAFDVLGDVVTEVNVTCPGLLVEVSYAYGENLAKQMHVWH